MAAREKQVQVKFKHWLAANWKMGSTLFELKQTPTDTLYRGALKDHQRDALLSAKHGMCYHKIDDTGRGHKPADCFVLQKSLAFVVIQFDSGCCMIDIDDYNTAAAYRPVTFAVASKIGKQIW